MTYNSELEDVLFSHDLLSPEELAAYIADQDFNTDIFDLRKKDFAKATNSIQFHEGQEFLATQELWPRQVEFLVKLFEEYCPDCSDTELLFSDSGLFGLTHDQIYRKICLLNHGKCPMCGKTKADFRQFNHYNDYSELIGVAGQRCLDPDTRVCARVSGVPMVRQLQDLRKGDEILGFDGEQSIWTDVRQVMSVMHAGHYKIHVPNRAKPFVCSDSHQWIIEGQQNTVLTVNLKEGDRIPMVAGEPVPILRIERIIESRMMIDIETGTANFYSEEGHLLHNSGKSYICSGIANYTLHRYCLLNKPAYKYFGLNAVPLTMTFCATIQAQIEETLWGQFKTLHDNSPWFQEYQLYLADEGKRLGKTLYNNLKTYISYNNINVRAGYMSARGSSLRGRTSILCAIDELGFFNHNSSLANGNDVYIALNNSLMTTRGKRTQLIRKGEVDPPPVLMLNVSSPSDETDPIMTLLNQAKTTDTRTSYCFHLATWEINPDLPYDSDDLTTARLRNSQEFWRNFGAKPVGVSDGWLQQKEMLTASAQLNRANIQTREHIFERMLDNGKMYNYVTRVITGCPTNFLYPHIITCDAGATQNSYCILVSHYDLERVRYVLDGAIEIKPGMTENGRPTHVHFDRAKTLIQELAQHFYTVMVVFDRWNSMQTLQQLRDTLRIDAIQRSPKLPDFNEFKARLENGEWSIPEMESSLFDPNLSSDQPITRLVKQTRSVYQKGKQIVPNGNSKDDLFRAWVLADMSISQNLIIFGKKNPNPYQNLNKIAKHRMDMSRYFQPTPIGAVRKIRSRFRRLNRR